MEQHEIPDFEKLIRSNGQALHTINFHKGKETTAYVSLRQWCWKNDLNFSDLLNGIIEGLDYYCHNFARPQGETSVVVTINLGDIELRRVRRPRSISTRGARHYQDQTPAVQKANRRATERKQYAKHIL